MHSTRSSNTKPTSSKFITTSTSPAKPPTADLVPLSHDESTTKEMNSIPSIHSSQILQTVIDHKNSRENPLDLDKASSVGEKSIADGEAAESVSDFSDYPAGSTTGIKSPYLGSRSGHVRTPSTTETFSAEFGGDGRSRNGSESTDVSTMGSEIYGARGGIELSRPGDWNQGTPIPDSPTVGRHCTASKKSPIIDSYGRQFSISAGDKESPRLPNFPMSSSSPNPTISSTATASTSARAERALHIPFLPRFLKVLGSPTGSEASRTYDEPEAIKEERNISEFEDESSDDDDEDVEEIMEIHEARLGVVGRPVLVHQSSSTVVGLKEMLHSGPVPSVIHPPPSLGSRNNPMPSTTKVARLLGREVIIHADPVSSVAQISPPPRLRGVPGPSTAKAAQILGHEVEVRDGIVESREHLGLIAGSAAAPIEAKEKGSTASEREITAAWANDGGLGSWRNPVSNIADGLRSNPVPATAKVHRSATVPSRRPRAAAIPQVPAPPLTSNPLTLSGPSSSHSQLDKTVLTDQDHYIQAVEEKLHTTMEELAQLKVELSSLKETIDGPEIPRRSRSSRLINCVFQRSTVPGRMK